MENINNFIKAAAQLGVPAQDMFQTGNETILHEN
jgi:hypothetical protein